jgi:magnesium-transporting ATPase (P-type)
MAVNTLILAEIFYLFSSRYMYESSLSVQGIKATPQVWGAVVAVLGLQIPFTYLPAMQKLFGTRAIGLRDWLIMAAIAACVFLIVELEKAVIRSMRRKRSRVIH